MRICHPTEKEQGIDNVLHGHFRSAPRYVVFDTDTKESDILGNQLPPFKKGKRQKQDLCLPIKSLDNLSVDAAIVGGVGRCALNRLIRCGIKVYQANSQTLEKNIEALVNGELTELTPRSVKRGSPC